MGALGYTCHIFRPGSNLSIDLDLKTVKHDNKSCLVQIVQNEHCSNILWIKEINYQILHLVQKCYSVLTLTENKSYQLGIF